MTAFLLSISRATVTVDVQGGMITSSRGAFPGHWNELNTSYECTGYGFDAEFHGPVVFTISYSPSPSQPNRPDKVVLNCDAVITVQGGGVEHDEASVSLGSGFNDPMGAQWTPATFPSWYFSAISAGHHYVVLDFDADTITWSWTPNARVGGTSHAWPLSLVLNYTWSTYSLEFTGGYDDGGARQVLTGAELTARVAVEGIDECFDQWNWTMPSIYRPYKLYSPGLHSGTFFGDFGLLFYAVRQSLSSQPSREVKVRFDKGGTFPAAITVAAGSTSPELQFSLTKNIRVHTPLTKIKAATLGKWYLIERIVGADGNLRDQPAINQDLSPRTPVQQAHGPNGLGAVGFRLYYVFQGSTGVVGKEGFSFLWNVHTVPSGFNVPTAAHPRGSTYICQIYKQPNSTLTFADGIVRHSQDIQGFLSCYGTLFPWDWQPDPYFQYPLTPAEAEVENSAYYEGMPMNIMRDAPGILELDGSYGQPSNVLMSLNYDSTFETHIMFLSPGGFYYLQDAVSLGVLRWTIEGKATRANGFWSIVTNNVNVAGSRTLDIAEHNPLQPQWFHFIPDPE